VVKREFEFDDETCEKVDSKSKRSLSAKKQDSDSKKEIDPLYFNERNFSKVTEYRFKCGGDIQSNPVIDFNTSLVVTKNRNKREDLISLDQLNSSRFAIDRVPVTASATCRG
jgi:hypothetical protein